MGGGQKYSRQRYSYECSVAGVTAGGGVGESAQPVRAGVPNLGGIPPMGGISEFLVGNGRLRQNQH